MAAERSSVIDTAKAGTVAMLTTVTTYSSCEPGSAAPPPTTATCFVIDSCWALPTTTTVGSGPVAGLPSPSVSRLGTWLLRTTAWLLMIVPPGTPAFTCRLYWTTALRPGLSVPPAAPGSGGVRSLELIGMPAVSGATPPSGRPTGRPFRVVESATYVVFAGTASVTTAPVVGTAPLL